MRRLFRSLRNFNYRVWAAGALVSNIGTWMQRAAQDWLVLTQLTRHSASAVGIVMALQFGPQLLMMPLSGFAADHFNQRKLLMATQATMGALALVLGFLTVTGLVQLWHVYVFAFLFGCSAALDAPVRQTFVAELVGDADLSNAIALNSTSFNAARMIGPAVAGIVIASVGTGWAFLFNGASFMAVLISLSLLRRSELRPNARAHRVKGSVLQGFHYVWSRSELRATLVMLFLIGTFGLNFPIFISTMAVSVFHTDARGFGLLTSVMAIGTISGALLAASRDRPRFHSLLVGAAVFGLGCTLAALAPSYWLFAAALIVIGVAALTVTNTSNALMQLSTEPAMRGRVMALRLGVALGGTPIGAPIVGWVADHLGPRWALGVGAVAGFAAAIVAIIALSRLGDETAGSHYQQKAGVRRSGGSRSPGKRIFRARWQSGLDGSPYGTVPAFQALFGRRRTAMEIKEHMEVIGADGVHLGTVDRVEGGRIKLTRKDSGEGSHKGHHHFIDKGLVAGVEGNKVRLSANANVAVTMEEEK